MATSKKNVPQTLIIDEESLTDASVKDAVFCPLVNGEAKGHGLVPRDLHKYPVEMFDPPSGMTLIPKSEWSARIKDKIKEKSQISDIRLEGNNGQPIPSLDQDGKGYCWAHSTTSAMIANRAVAHQPYVPLSAYAVACIIKGYRDEGGWCGLSAKFARERGIPSQQFWPQQSMSRSNDKPETWANAARHKLQEEWTDLTRDVYDVQLTFDQLATCLLSNIACPVDFNWWSHSVCAIDLVEVEAGSFGILIWNSWGDSWSTQGMGVLRGSKAIPDSALAIRTSGISPD